MTRAACFDRFAELLASIVRLARRAALPLLLVRHDLRHALLDLQLVVASARIVRPAESHALDDAEAELGGGAHDAAGGERRRVEGLALAEVPERSGSGERGCAYRYFFRCVMDYVRPYWMCF